MISAVEYDKQIHDTIQNYFRGTYEANEEKIRLAFHDKAVISGFFDGVYTEWSLDEFVERVKSQPSQLSQKEVFAKKIISVDKKENIAIVKAIAPAYGHNFSDFISLIKTEEGWKIRHKSFTNSLME